jgi:hypothetical protein
MTNMETIAVRYFFTVLGLAGLGVVCFGLRAYTRDLFRQRAFAIRDELFDYAASGAISFDDPAYWRLRLAMNSVIRYSHRFTFGEAILPPMIYVVLGWKPAPRPAWDAWRKALARQSDDVQAKLNDFDKRFDLLSVKHLLLTTPLSWPLILIVAIMHGFRVESTAVTDFAVGVEEEALRLDDAIAA